MHFIRQKNCPSKLIITILLFISAVHSFGQNSGYQGRKFFITANSYFCPAISNPTVKGNYGIFALNNRWYFDFNATVARRLTLGLGFETYNTGFKIDYGNYSGWGESKICQPWCTKLNVCGIGINTRIYLKNNIAPLGPYVKLESMVISSKVNPDTLGYRALYFQSMPDFNNSGRNETFIIKIDFCNSHLFFNRLLLDYGLQLGLMLDPRMSYSNVSKSTDTYFQAASQKRLFEQYLFNFHIGIGVLLF